MDMQRESSINLSIQRLPLQVLPLVAGNVSTGSGTRGGGEQLVLPVSKQKKEGERERENRNKNMTKMECSASCDAQIHLEWTTARMRDRKTQTWRIRSVA